MVADADIADVAPARPRRRFASRRRLRTPLFPQLEPTECGAACLGIVLAHHGRWESIDELRTACGVSRDGSSAADIADAARKYGLRARGWRSEVDQLPELSLPLILFWEFNHFVVLEGIGSGSFYLNDPANGRRVVGEETFGQAFTGVVLSLEPTEEFRRGGIRPGVARRLMPWLRDVRKPLAFAALCGGLLALPGLALPVLLTTFVDGVLAGSERSWGTLVAVAALAAAGLTYLLAWLQQHCLRRLAVRLSVVHAERFLSRLFRLPAQYLAHRYAGDLSSRVQLVDGVADSASRQFISVMIELVMSVLFLALMVVYDPLLAVIVVAIAGGGALLMRTVTRLQSDENQQMRREQALLFGLGAFGLRSVDFLRATGKEDDFFARWSGYQARELVARQRFAELGYVTAALPRFFAVAAGAVALGVGGWRVMSGDMTIGVLMGFYVVAGNFLAPIGRFVQFANAFRILEADLMRLDDTYEAGEDPDLADRTDPAPSRIATLDGRLRLTGQLELRNVTFGYRPNRPPLIEDFSLRLDPGQRVAVIGATGSGKSTLVKLLGGMYSPWSGEILYDGVLRRDIPRKVLTDSIATVDQQIMLFAASVRANLTMWNPTVPDHQLVAAATDALIHDDIMGRTSGYESPVEEGGRNFSGGQRQRLEIARALVNNPSILLLDEATSTLDSVGEMRIDDALRRRGCTCLIIAHRLSTIRDSDLIIVMDRGREIQRGTHDELIADRAGMYHQLVAAE